MGPLVAVESFSLCVRGVNASVFFCGTCVLALGALYLKNMSMYGAYIHMNSVWTTVAEEYDFGFNLD